MKKTIQILLGLLIGGFLLWFLFRGTDWNAVWAATRNANVAWLAAAFAAIMLSFFTRVQRWTSIVRTAKDVSFRSLFSATQIGFLANFTLPGRAGEVIRAVVLARLERIPFSKCFAFVALDRVTDLFGLIAIMLVSVIAFQPAGRVGLPPDIHVPDWAGALLEPDAIRSGAIGFSLLLLAVVGVFVVLYVSQSFALRVAAVLLGVAQSLVRATVAPMLRGLGNVLGARVRATGDRLGDADLVGLGTGMIREFAEGLHVFRSAADMSKAILFSLITWAVACFSYYCALRAFGFVEPWYTALIVTAMLSVAIALPGAPGFIGQFHFGIIIGIFVCIPDADYDVAKAVAIMSHLLNVLAVAIVGIWSLYREDFGLLELKRDADQRDED